MTLTPSMIGNIQRQEEARNSGLVFVRVFQVAVIPLTETNYLVTTVLVSSMNDLEFHTELSLYRHIGDNMLVRERTVRSQFTIDPNEVI